MWERWGWKGGEKRKLHQGNRAETGNRRMPNEGESDKSIII